MYYPEDYNNTLDLIRTKRLRKGFPVKKIGKPNSLLSSLQNLVCQCNSESTLKPVNWDCKKEWMYRWQVFFCQSLCQGWQGEGLNHWKIKAYSYISQEEETSCLGFSLCVAFSLTEEMEAVVTPHMRSWHVIWIELCLVPKSHIISTMMLFFQKRCWIKC